MVAGSPPPARRTADLVGIVLLSVLLPVQVGSQSDLPPLSPHLLVVGVKATRLYHLPTCPELATARGTTVMSVEQAERRGYRRHRCPAVAGEKAQSGEATAATLVWVDLKTRRYHLAGCSLVGLPRAQMTLAEAAARYRPCRACKPPAPPPK